MNIFRDSDSRLLLKVGNLAFLGGYTQPLNGGDGGRGRGRGDDDGGEKPALLPVGD